MPTWNPEQYLKFGDERTQPCRDLVARIALSDPRRIVDLGCGPGNSTGVLAKRWPTAELTGVDYAAEMIRAAREQFSQIQWQEGNIATWTAKEPMDLVFSNAALQWVPGHNLLVPHLFEQVAAGGALAWQMPANFDAPAHTAMRDLAASARWRAHFAEPVREGLMHSTEFYYDLLAPHAARLVLWKTEYVHIMESPAAIVEWYKGTGLRPFLDRLQSPADQELFLADYQREIERAYPRQANGRVLFPFLRMFGIAYRG